MLSSDDDDDTIESLSSPQLAQDTNRLMRQREHLKQKMEQKQLQQLQRSVLSGSVPLPSAGQMDDQTKRDRGFKTLTNKELEQEAIQTAQTKPKPDLMVKEGEQQTTVDQAMQLEQQKTADN